MKRLFTCCLVTAGTLLVGACQDGPMSPASTLAPKAPSLTSIPSGAMPYHSVDPGAPPYLIVDQDGELIWQDLSLASLGGAFSPFEATGGYFRLFVTQASGDLEECVPRLSGLTYVWAGCNDRVAPWDLWFGNLAGGANPRECGHQPYPLGHWYWFEEHPCYSSQYISYHLLVGTQFRAVAAPTAPGGLVFKRWEIRIENEVQPCAEGPNSPTCTITALKDYPFGVTTAPGPFFKLVYGPPFQGFFAPVDNAPTLNSVKAGSAVPVKFSLTGDQGLNIFVEGSPSSQPIQCNTSVAVDAIEQTVTSGNSSLSYDAATDTYTYVWKTEKSFAGTCRAFTIALTDGTTHTANFKFVK